ncbi:hypothetical protein ACO0SA_004269 [Hanseniaspora valbyensis]
MFSAISRSTLRNSALKSRIQFYSTHTKDATYKSSPFLWIKEEAKRTAKLLTIFTASMTVIVGWPYIYRYVIEASLNPKILI